MTTDKFCFYLQNRLIQTSQTGGQWYSDIPPLVFPGSSKLVCLSLTPAKGQFFSLVTSLPSSLLYKVGWRQKGKKGKKRMQDTAFDIFSN
jgi:hypothetical protein